MGTNFYAYENCCKRCGRGDNKLHIGKQSCGWAFSFHAVSEWESWDERPIENYQRWREVLSQPEVGIIDENGTHYDAEEFFAVICYKGKNHAVYMRDEYVYPSGTDATCQQRNKYFLDDEGWSFTCGDFS